MSTSSKHSLSDFTAYELPSKKWLKLVSPKVRLRVQGMKAVFVSSAVMVTRTDSGADDPGTKWPWNGDERSPRPSLVTNESFHIIVERRFLLRYKSICRTKSMTIDDVWRGGEPCKLPLYDGQHPTELLEDQSQIQIGSISFVLGSD